MSRRTRAVPAIYCLLLGLCGCLPNSCAKVESRELFPADSLSRALAESIVDDTLALRGVSFGIDGEPLEYPRTIMFTESGDLLVGDVGRGNIISIGRDLDGSSLVADGIEFPFLLDATGTEFSVFDASTNSILDFADRSVSSNVPLQGDIPKASVRYAAKTDSAIYLKVVPDEGAATISRYTLDGVEEQTRQLEGAAWQWAGLMRLNEGRLTSFRGYHPRFDYFDYDLQRDSVNLVGFDSPMLARTRNFMLGDAKAPPLLTASSAFSRSRYFVLNIRPGWTRIDVYNSEPVLTDILIRDEPTFNKDFFPTDIAVLEQEPGRYIIAVSYVKPDARVEFYEWTDHD